MALRQDERFMRLALCQARKGLGKTSPNPAVGALIVKDGVILSSGYHRKAGGPHAEIEAISALSDAAEARGATLYVTLEPCSTHGRTPPCTEAIIQTGFARVVIGAIDPDPRHLGRGVELLKAAGVEVLSGVLAEESAKLNVGFNKWIVTGAPWIIAKVARSLDGYITRPPGESSWLSNHRSLRLVQRLRSTVDAILVGAETVRKDNPKLTLRPLQGRPQPWRVVITRSGNLPSDAALFTDEFSDRTLVFRDRPWSEVFQELGRLGVTRLLVEGGGEILGGLLAEHQIDQIWCFITPRLTGGDKTAFAGPGITRNEDGTEITPIRYKRIGADLLVVGEIKRRFAGPS
jgi:diaminohydroxyphosphoribosylaminopyrimidine deaminase/5-amino-6-(5-phosphoribosylamino)uracil reductase